jgi:hypothetical protein
VWRGNANFASLEFARAELLKRDEFAISSVTKRLGGGYTTVKIKFSSYGSLLMRAKMIIGLFMMGCAVLAITPAINGQFKKGQGGGAPGGGKKGAGGGDANAMFDYYSKGKPYVVITDVRFGQQQMAQFAQDKGITNGQLTRAQFVEYQEQMNAKIAAGMSGMGKGGPGGGGPGGKRPGGGDGGFPVPGGMNVSPSVDVINQLADADFKRRDANGDGRLNQEEMPGPLKFGLAKWDKNGDGLIDLQEYRDYFASRLGGGGGGDDGGTRGIASIIIEEEELDRKPVVFRVGGKMPAGLPAWFKELDADLDGQVALYEWRKGGKALDEFKLWDINDDGFITPEEAVKYQATIAAGSNVASAESAAYPSERPQFKTKGGGGDGTFPGGFDMSKFKKGDKGGKKKDRQQ